MPADGCVVNLQIFLEVSQHSVGGIFIYKTEMTCDNISRTSLSHKPSPHITPTN